VAKNKTKDYLKRNHTFTSKIVSDFKEQFKSLRRPNEIDLSSQNIKDSQLQMIFAICDPIIPAEAQIGLALRILCGFGIDELAEAFLTNKETINKRLYRAKEKLRLSTFKIESLHEFEINKRLETVLTTIYLLV
jgi:predicted RNA polymerase sigma factor